MKHTPAGSSTAQVIHYGQGMKSHRFAQFDYGTVTNLRRYLSRRPPAYPLSQIDSPIILHYSLNDWMAAKVDVLELAKHLRHAHLDEVDHPRFNHLDFVWAKNIKELLYNKIINKMARSDAGESFLVL